MYLWREVWDKTKAIKWTEIFDTSKINNVYIVTVTWSPANIILNRTVAGNFVIQKRMHWVEYYSMLY